MNIKTNFISGCRKLNSREFYFTYPHSPAEYLTIGLKTGDITGALVKGVKNEAICKGCLTDLLASFRYVMAKDLKWFSPGMSEKT